MNKYQPGLNEYLDAIHDGETVWIIQGDRGLRPVIADTAEEAEAKYLLIKKKNYSALETM